MIPDADLSLRKKLAKELGREALEIEFEIEDDPEPI